MQEFVKSVFPQSPFYIIENAISRVLESGLSLIDVLPVLESELKVVSSWHDRFESMDDLVDERSRQMQYLGTEGNFIMMEAIELAYEAVSEMSLECLQEALQQLEEGHLIVEASLEICEALESEADDNLFEALESTIF